MVEIKRHKNVQLGRIVSCGFEQDNDGVESVFSQTRKFGPDYRYFGLLATTNGNDVLGGINGNLQEGVYYLDEIWVQPDYRGIFIGKRLLIALKKILNEKNIACACYPHLECLEDYLIGNGITDFACYEDEDPEVPEEEAACGS